MVYKLKPKICIECGKEFKPFRLRHKTCGIVCYKKTQKKYMKKYWDNNPELYRKNKLKAAKRQWLQTHDSLDDFIYKEVFKNKQIGHRSGKNHHNWIGGISYYPYCHKFNEKLKEKIRERDNRICQLCGKNEKDNKRRLSVHHVHYDKENCYPDLISLCISCNFKVNNNRDYWEQYFMKILKERNFIYD